MTSGGFLSSVGKSFSKLIGKDSPSGKSRIPYLIVWNFTNSCNLKCKHCYQDAQLEPTADELTLDEKLRFVDTLANAGVKVPMLSGGEPLLHPDFFPILEKLASRKMHASAASNATMITPDFAKKLKDTGLGYIEISLDSIIPEKHDDFRGMKGTWGKTVEGIKNCLDAGIFTAISTVFTKNTLDEVDAMVDFAASLGVHRFIHFNFVPTGRGPNITDQDLSPEERETVLIKLFKKRRTAGLEVLSTAPQFGRVCLEQSLGKKLKPDYIYVETKTQKSSQFYISSPTHFSMLKDNGKGDISLDAVKGCGAGRQFCCIQPNGDVTPCMFIPDYIVGNIRNEPFKVLWKKLGDEPCFMDREILDDECGSCQFRYVCGGCRARAINYIGNKLAADTGCLRNKNKWLDEQGKN